MDIKYINNGNSLVESASTKELLKKEKYQELFGDRVFNICKLGGYYRFSCAEKGQIRIQTFADRVVDAYDWHTHKTSQISIPTDDCTIECYINEDWYQYIPKKELIKTNLPFLLIRDCWHWHSTERNEMLICDKDNQITAKVRTEKLTSNDLNSNTFRLLQIESIRQERILYLEDLDNYLNCISRIESRDECLIFQNKNGRYTRVILPRLVSIQKQELCFTFDELGQKAQLDGEEHFTIAQYIPRLVGFLEDYLVLEDKEHNKKKVLIPVQPIAKNMCFFSEKISLAKLTEEEEKEPLKRQKGHLSRV